MTAPQPRHSPNSSPAAKHPAEHSREAQKGAQPDLVPPEWLELPRLHDLAPRRWRTPTGEIVAEAVNREARELLKSDPEEYFRRTRRRLPPCRCDHHPALHRPTRDGCRGECLDCPCPDFRAAERPEKPKPHTEPNYDGPTNKRTSTPRSKHE